MRVKVIKASLTQQYGDPWLYLKWAWSATNCKFSDWKIVVCIMHVGCHGCC